MVGNYLRARGEYWLAKGGLGVVVELPPRTRRILFYITSHRFPAGTTSAHAENTLLHGLDDIVIGELPPRTRRIPTPVSVKIFALGTTSAHAENTHDWGVCPSGGGNYLRARGEYPVRCLSGYVAWELPPRTRRILSLPPLAVAGDGTTSAHAENTFPTQPTRYR